MLVSGCLSVCGGVRELQRKCYAHHGKAIASARDLLPESEYLSDVASLLLAARALKKAAKGLSQHELAEMRRHLGSEACGLLPKERSDPVEEPKANRLRKQRDHLFTFLDHPPVPGTNNRAERALRPAVISRKISCGNTTSKGARTWEVGGAWPRPRSAHARPRKPSAMASPTSHSSATAIPRDSTARTLHTYVPVGEEG